MTVVEDAAELETPEELEDFHAFRACIHRGSQQIGGTCIELASGDARILLDLGLPLDAGDMDPKTLLPPIKGLHEPDPNLFGIVISHGHADHWGLAPYVGPDVRIITGAGTRRMMGAAAAFVPRYIELGPDDDGRLDLEDGKTIDVGPFAITPYLVDHSAFDAYAMLIEANGRRLFYSADIRGHGRKAALFERLLRNPPHPIHAMLMEGSSIGRLQPDQSFPTETEIEQRLVDSFRAPGFVGVCASAQNIDRLVSIYRACKRTGRTLVLDIYAMEMLGATGKDTVPGPGWPNLAVYVPEYQRRHIARTKRFDLTDKYKPYRIYREYLAKFVDRAVMLCRPPMVFDIDKTAGAWNGARIIWSQWDGYLSTPANVAFTQKMAERGVGMEVIHTSGHASIVDLKRLAEALAPEVLVPVHTFKGERYSELFGTNVCRHADGEWWRI
jgi:ribonuclease J